MNGALPPDNYESLRHHRKTRLRRLLLACASALIVALFIIALLPLPTIAHAAAGNSSASEASAEDPVTTSVRHFLQAQTSSLGDHVTIEVSPSTADLGECASPEPFLPRPGVPQGRVVVGVRCADGDGSRYLRAEISAMIRHLVAKQAVAPGEIVDSSTLDWQTSDISRLRRGYLTSMEGVAGQVATRRIPQGATLTDAMVRKPWMVKRGDTVQLSVIGQGFRISRRVEALENGSMGSTIRLRTGDNRILQGTVTGPDSLSAGDQRR
ncbi:flagellar basal body P-ring formation chaperone FlgA [Salinicola avicenniae]|uniref:flagellar basal body P-ring formation chaperone FlgA n=1 Tax=Salinicola avicenniae TaxID=2916836 RepID=UPI00207442D1|nr:MULTISPECIES: flagellar basal body P-ring formation chaperone FlgA [unclassified Salinicola]